MREEPTTIRDYEVLAKLSSGGMGDVLLARRRGAHGFEKLLALKVIKGQLAERADIRAMFLDEARLVARLDHPNIAQVYDFGETEGVLYLTMEYVPGIPLNQLLAKRSQPLPPLVAARIAAEVARGLHAAHQLTDIEGRPLGVVHRDVSPGNLIFTYDGRLKILDFGIAFMSERESPDTQIGELKGKPSYMAPEQLRAERVDRRSDVYALSVILHEMLTGRKLFSKGNMVATAMAVERGEVVAPGSIVPLPDGLDRVVMRGLEKDPEDRFPDAREMARALEAVIAAEGGVALEGFVEEELSEARSTHRAWLQRVLAAAKEQDRPEEATVPIQLRPRPPGYEFADAETVAPKTARGSPSSVREPAAAPAPEEPSFEIVAETPPIVRGTSAAGTSADERSLAPPPRRRAWIPLALLAAALGLVFALFGLGPTGTLSSTPAGSPASSRGGPSASSSGGPSSSNPEPSAKGIDRRPSAPPASPAVQAEDPSPLPPASGRAHTSPPTDPALAEVPRPAETPPRRRRPAASRQVPAEATGVGFLTVGATPYANVRIDGRELGATPLVQVELPAGRHRLELVSPDTGEIRLVREVVIQKGAHARITIP